MGVLSHKIDRALRAGVLDSVDFLSHLFGLTVDIYPEVFLASTQSYGKYVGGNKVVHFTRVVESTPNAGCFNSYSSSKETGCPNFPDCGFRRLNGGMGVVLTCLDCFLGKGSFYLFGYGTPRPVFMAKIRGGRCTTAQSNLPETVIHRTMYPLQNGFGNYNVFQSNCEDFGLYCKTGLLIVDKSGVGRSGQALALVGASLAAVLSSPFKFFMASPVGVATVTAGVYCMSRYATDIGVRTDVVKVPVEEMTAVIGDGTSGEGSLAIKEKEKQKN